MQKIITNPVIEAEKVSKTIPLQSGTDLMILNNISLSILPSESVAISGISGSGKTTLLGLLAGLDVPSSGDIKLLGQPLNQLDEDGRAAVRLGKVGFVFQSFHLMDNLTALENVMFPVELGKNRKNAKTMAMDALKQVGLETRADHLPGQLSGGEQQRVALARAFVIQPAVLFADEPTGNLDPGTGQEIISLLFSLQEQYKTTLVLVTHDDVLAEKCQTSCRLSEGRLLKQ